MFLCVRLLLTYIPVYYIVPSVCAGQMRELDPLKLNRYELSRECWKSLRHLSS